VTPSCMQKCLLGLKQRDILDEGCHNYLAHRCGTAMNRHHIDTASLRRFLQEQLSQDMDHNCDPLNKHYSRLSLHLIGTYLLERAQSKLLFSTYGTKARYTTGWKKFKAWLRPSAPVILT
jgi:hypothetical protein